MVTRCDKIRLAALVLNPQQNRRTYSNESTLLETIRLRYSENSAVDLSASEVQYVAAQNS